jgi:putative transposase
VNIRNIQSVRRGSNQFLNGVDGNKKVKGIKLHIVMDKNDFLLAVMVTVVPLLGTKPLIYSGGFLKN